MGSATEPAACIAWQGRAATCAPVHAVPSTLPFRAPGPCRTLQDQALVARLEGIQSREELKKLIQEECGVVERWPK